MRVRPGVVLFLSSILVVFGAHAAESRARSVQVDATTFECIRDMSPVRGFYVDNVLGDLDATLAAANAANGAVYPAGSVVQLVPGEAMVKREAGFSPGTRDWEFFELDTTTGGATIRKRGFADVVNRFGGNCLACHAKAKPQWDMICETDHGCDPIPLTREMVVVLQKTDPRCAENPPLSAEETELLKALRQSLQPGT